MSHELYGCLALTGPGGANVRVSRHWHSAQELTTLTVMEKLVLVDCEGSASTQDHACTKWVFTLMYLYITYGTKFSGAAAVWSGILIFWSEGKLLLYFFVLIFCWHLLLHEIIYNVFSEFFHQTPTAAPVFVQRRYLRRILPIKCLW